MGLPGVRGPPGLPGDASTAGATDLLLVYIKKNISSLTQ